MWPTRPSSFDVPDVSTWWLVAGGVAVAGRGVAGTPARRRAGRRRRSAWRSQCHRDGPTSLLGPSAMPLPSFTVDAFVAAATALVLPQVPLTFANSCLAPADAARVYFGEEAAEAGDTQPAGGEPGCGRPGGRCDRWDAGLSRCRGAHGAPVVRCPYRRCPVHHGCRPAGARPRRRRRPRRGPRALPGGGAGRAAGGRWSCCTWRSPATCGCAATGWWR